MKYIRLTMRNFVGFKGEHTFVFESGVWLICGPNGAGKTSIFAAIAWALTGKNPRGGKADDVTHWGEKNCEVSLELEGAAGEAVTVTRTRPSGLTLTVDGVDRSALDTDVTQAALERVLKFDPVVFGAAVMFGQDRQWSLATATDAEAKKLLARILPELAQFDIWASNTGAIRSTLDTAIASATSNRDNAQQRVDRARAHDPRVLSSEWEADRQVRFANAVQAQEEAIRRHSGAVEFHTQIAQSGPAAVPPVALGEVVDLTNAYQRIGVINAEAIRESAQINQSSCPTCHRPYADQETIEATTRAARDRVADLRTELATLQKHVQEGERRNSLRNLAERQYTDGVANAQYAWEKATSDAKRVEETWQAELLRCNTTLASISTETNPHTPTVDQWAAENIEAADEHAKASEVLANCLKERGLADYWVKALGRSGIPSVFLDSQVDLLSEYANRFVTELTEGRFTCQVRTRREVGKGIKTKLKDDFHVVVFRYGGAEQDIDTLSGGEREVVKLGVDLGAQRLAAERAGLGSTVLFLDEIFQRSLDASTRVKVAALLRRLATEYDAIYVIDHDPTFQGMFDNVVTVSSVDDQSAIEVHRA